MIPFNLSLDVIIEAPSIFDALGVLATSAAAIATAYAAYATHKASESAEKSAIAAEKSANQWKEQISFNLYYQKAGYALAAFDKIDRALFTPCLVNIISCQNDEEIATAFSQIGTARNVILDAEVKPIRKKILNSIEVLEDSLDNVYQSIKEAHILSKEHIKLSASAHKNIGYAIEESHKLSLSILDSFKMLGFGEAREVDVKNIIKKNSQRTMLSKKSQAYNHLMEAYLKFLLDHNNKNSQKWDEAKTKFIQDLYTFSERVQENLDEKQSNNLKTNYDTYFD
ncbi:hypothetical protein [Vibrio sp. SCSIO 43137]|uniref:hypothetical protein n=1 Tax=Vibrio sp. SCSIO 43137 TaxID=3021011 RepID=UPI0023081DAA|nr:hypothetical protein [Vibrio sp. SCSIO 43137]WCE31042.1 hypothetical protein PK654_07195 [Vibrio sp. SCSIO 43137]